MATGCPSRSTTSRIPVSANGCPFEERAAELDADLRRSASAENADASSSTSRPSSDDPPSASSTAPRRWRVLSCARKQPVDAGVCRVNAVVTPKRAASRRSHDDPINADIYVLAFSTNSHYNGDDSELNGALSARNAGDAE